MPAQESQPLPGNAVNLITAQDGSHRAVVVLLECVENPEVPKEPQQDVMKEVPNKIIEPAGNLHTLLTEPVRQLDL